jgi:hypothetical protein
MGALEPWSPKGRRGIHEKLQGRPAEEYTAGNLQRKYQIRRSIGGQANVRTFHGLGRAIQWKKITQKTCCSDKLVASIYWIVCDLALF